MVPVKPARKWTSQDATRARAQFEARQRRLAQRPESLKQSAEMDETATSASAAATEVVTSALPDKQQAIAQALARARARRASRPVP